MQRRQRPTLWHRSQRMLCPHARLQGGAFVIIMHQGFAQALVQSSTTLGVYRACPIMAQCKCQLSGAFQLHKVSLPGGEPMCSIIMGLQDSKLPPGNKTQRQTLIFQPLGLCR